MYFDSVQFEISLATQFTKRVEVCPLNTFLFSTFPFYILISFIICIGLFASHNLLCKKKRANEQILRNRERRMLCVRWWEAFCQLCFRVGLGEEVLLAWGLLLNICLFFFTLYYYMCYYTVLLLHC